MGEDGEKAYVVATVADDLVDDGALRAGDLVGTLGDRLGGGGGGRPALAAAGGGGPEALWWGLVTGLAAASVLLLARFHRQVGRAVRKEAVPTDANGAAPPASAVEVPADGETRSG